MKMTIEELTAREEHLASHIEEAREKRDAAVDAVLGSCIHNLSDAICNLRQADGDFYEAITRWGDIADKLEEARAKEADTGPGQLHAVN